MKPRYDAAYNPAAPQVPRRPLFIPNGPSMMGICCGQCGHDANLEDFEKSPLGLAIPEGQFQCPGCGLAWKIVHEPGCYHQPNPSLPAVWLPGKKSQVLIDPYL